ncbi:MAG: hypothetical protein HY908_37145 [Myxococcales bacterium]|nr:hypothetical protein [Myxococcales bacterium]
MSDAPAPSGPVSAAVPAAEPAPAAHAPSLWGPLALIVTMPVVSLYLWVCIHRHGGALVVPSLDELPLPSLRAAGYLAAWLAFQIVLQLVLPGRTVEGLPGLDGVRLRYRLNGLLSLVVSVAVLAGLWAGGVVSGATVLAELGALLVVAILASFALGLFLYAYGLRSRRPEQRSGRFVHDFFMGTARNPRIGDFDLKLFFESKIGMTTWLALALAMAAAEHERDGALSAPMVLVCAFQLLYVVDFYLFESAMLSTWDINHENYGFMLAFAFLVWMPFNFSLQAQYLVYASPSLPAWATVALVLMNAGGYYVFRSSNLQKHAFRTRPGARIWGKAPTSIQTARGTALLTSGWWGLARHANYLGDLTMALAWCLPCGFSHVPPYFYFIYFAPLLIDRERRDHRHCAAKYGADWDAYCRRVRYRIVPGIY